MILAFQFRSPGPILLDLGLIQIRWYGLLIALAVLIGLTLAQNLAKRRNFDPNLVSDFIIWAIIAAIVGARIYYVIFEWGSYAQRPQDILAIWKGGIAIHGAIIGGSIAGLIFTRWHRVSFWGLADIMTPSLILGQAIGRWGNFFNSEAFGRPTNLPWKLYIPPVNRPLNYINFQYFHPTFLYESIWNLGVFVLLIWLFFWGLKHGNKLKTGTITFVYLIAYSCGRFWIEGLRTDSLMFGPLRMAQIVSLMAIALGIFGLIWLYKLKKPLISSSDDQL
jgi:phosphatidylglycerol:prolipoprotein diacylglycerol transferase